MSSLHWAWVSVTSRCHTWLKSHPIDINQLSSKEKAQVVPDRSILRCKVLNRQNNHTHLEMNGLGDWWVLDSHWKGLTLERSHTPYLVEGDLVYLKDFPYFYQESDKEEDSQVFTFTMCLKYFDTPNINGTMDYLRVLNKHGKSLSKEANKATLNEFGMNATFSQSLDPQDIKEEIKTGRPVAASLLSKGTIDRPYKGTHLVAITGYGNDYWLVQDPFGSMDIVNGLWSDRGPFAGHNVRYSFKDMNRRLFVSGRASGWGWVNFRKCEPKAKI